MYLQRVPHPDAQLLGVPALKLVQSPRQPGEGRKGPEGGGGSSEHPGVPPTLAGSCPALFLQSCPYSVRGAAGALTPGQECPRVWERPPGWECSRSQECSHSRGCSRSQECPRSRERPRSWECPRSYGRGCSHSWGCSCSWWPVTVQGAERDACSEQGGETQAGSGVSLLPPPMPRTCCCCSGFIMGGGSHPSEKVGM